MKKLRALLRLARGELGRAAVRARERLLPRRGARAGRHARLRRDARDARQPRPAGRASAWSCARRSRRERDADGAGDRDAAAAQRRGDPEGGAQARGRLAARARLVRGAREGARAHLQARPAARFAAAREEPSVEALHEWRKRVKELWYHHTLLRTLWPPVMRPPATRRTSCPTGWATTTTSPCWPRGSSEHAEAEPELFEAVDAAPRRAPGGGVRPRRARVRREADGVRAAGSRRLWDASRSERSDVRAP